MKRLFILLTAMCLLLGLTACMDDSTSIGIIGGADGPTEIIVEK